VKSGRDLVGEKIEDRPSPHISRIAASKPARMGLIVQEIVSFDVLKENQIREVIDDRAQQVPLGLELLLHLFHFRDLPGDAAGSDDATLAIPQWELRRQRPRLSPIGEDFEFDLSEQRQPSLHYTPLVEQRFAGVLRTIKIRVCFSIRLLGAPESKKKREGTIDPNKAAFPILEIDPVWNALEQGMQ